MGIEVSKIIVKVNDKKLKLSVKEAKRLRDTLNNLLGEKQIVYPVTYPTYPIIPN